MKIHPHHLLLSLCLLLLVACSSTATPGPGRVREPTATSPQPTPGRAQPQLATTYHVAPDGDDSSDGSAANPWRTLQHAVDAVAPGDTILVHAGQYAGARIEQSGTANAPITLSAAPGETATIDRPGPANRHNSNLELETWEGSGTVAYWIIANLEVRSAPNWGIDIRGSDSAKSHHITVRGSFVHHNGLNSGTTGIFAAFTDDVLIEDNDSSGNGEHGIYVNNSSDRFTIRGNRLHHNAAAGIHLNGDASQGGDGIMSDGLVENNIIYENGSAGGAGINMDGVTSTTLRNNLLYHNHASGIAIFQQDGAVCSQNNQVLHNTILMPDDGRWALIIGDTACVDNQLFNNILFSYHSYRGSINLPAGTVSGLVSDYNILVDRLTIDDGDSILTLAQWQALGYDTHSFLATPGQLFADEAAADYHLPPNSPAIDTGRDNLNVSTDLDGHPRPAGAGYDIGAYEYGSQPTPLDQTSYLPLLRQPPRPGQDAIRHHAAPPL